MKKIGCFFLLTLIAVVLLGCNDSNGEENTKTGESESLYYIYYLDNNETQLVREEYKPIGVTMEEQIEEYIEALRNLIPKNLTYKKALPDYVTITAGEVAENEQLTLNFDSSYLNLTGASEVLCRAAIVKTICQVEDINYVEFLIEGQPLKKRNDIPVGFMKAEDFIDNTGGETKYEQNATVTLYFSDITGKKLSETRVNIKYDGTISLEELVISQLIKGPKSIKKVKEGEVLPTVSSDTILNKVTVKDGICYADFNTGFLQGAEGVQTNIAVYSIVNSLIEIYNINKVQILIDGQIVNKIGDGFDLSAPIERNLDIVLKKD